MPAGAIPGERRGGRAKGVKNHASIAREESVKAGGAGHKGRMVNSLISEMRNPTAARLPSAGSALGMLPFRAPEACRVGVSGRSISRFAISFPPSLSRKRNGRTCTGRKIRGFE